MSGVGNREVAHRLFAAEYDDASLEYAESDEERAPNFVVTPTGARVNRLFVVGVLTSVEDVNEDTVRARIADPTGAFVVYAGQYQPDEHAALQSLEAPAFVAVTGKANTFQPDGSDRVLTSVRPESVTEVDAESRDRWVVTAAEHTLGRIATLADALDREERDDDLAAVLRGEGIDPGLAEGVARAIDHYGTTPDYLGALRELVLQAVEVVAGERDEADSLDLAPDEATGEYAAGDLAASAPEGASAVTEGAVPPEELEEPETDERDASEPEAGDSEADAGSVEEPEADAEADVAPDEETAGEDVTDDETADEATTDGEAAEAAPSESTGASDATADAGADAGSAGEADGESDEDELYEVDEEERERIEEEYGVGFESGTEVDEPGEAGIETDQPDDVGGNDVESEEAAEADEAEEPDAEAETDAEEAETGEPEAEGAEGTSAGDETAADDESDDADDEVAGDADVEDVLLSEMERLDEGDGADREDLVEAVSAETGAGADAVDDAIDDALMSGKCYEPSEGTLKPI